MARQSEINIRMAETYSAIALRAAVDFVAGSQGVAPYNDADFDRVLDRVTRAHAHFLDILAPMRKIEVTGLNKIDSEFIATAISCPECGAIGEDNGGLNCLVTCSLQPFPSNTRGR